ncbi:MAG: C4-dicarboxylate ABC transporter [Robiginitomaculum sp.]|nr:MAG: C4-dicarboxylate ABC transporter [Robiginitomaculum sp.]
MAVTGLGLSGCGGKTGTRILRAADAHPEGYPTVEAVRAMGKLLEERSDGRLRLKVFPGGQLGNEKDTLEITIFGGLDINRISIAPLSAVVPEAIVPTLPFLFRDRNHMRAALDGAPGRTILKSFERHRLIGLCFYDAGARSFYTKERLIRTPDDLKGMKIRVMNSDMFVSMVEALGGDATPMAYAEVYQGLMQGVVDGAENNWPSYHSSRHFEVAGKYSLTQHAMAPEVLLVSQRRWKTYTPEDQALIRQAAVDSVPIMREIWDARTAKAEAEIRAAGIEVITPDQAAFVEKVQPVWDKYLTNPALRKLAEDIQNVRS